MMPEDNVPAIDEPTDASLVAACLDGDRSAYGQIVARYQRLLCSLAYSAVGNVSESEDIAQEAFIEGWRKLGSLREASKLRPWLCGILRHKVGRRHRKAAREPVYRADPYEDSGEVESQEESVEGQAIRKEEQALLWQALERVPERYREPLVLYYREHQSIEHVACNLDLSEDAVKQRLSRGRKMLQEQMMAFVEGALRKSTPGRIFTLGVLAALPEFATPAKAAGAGAAAAAAHGSLLAKSTTIAALLASITGVVNTIIALRAALDQSRTPRERRAVVKATLFSFFGCLGPLAVVYLLRESAYQWWDYRLTFAVVSQALLACFVLGWPVAMIKMLRHFRRLRAEERRLHPEYFLDERDQIGSTESAYRSRARLFGVPLVHLRFAAPETGQAPVLDGSRVATAPTGCCSHGAPTP